VAALSVVVPVYNSAGTLAALAGRLTAVLDSVADEWEVVLVNDGSEDGSWAEVSALAARDARFRGLDLMRNYGQHNALLAGIRAAHHPTLVTLDDDLQNPPEEIPKLLAALDAGADVVYGWSEEPSFGVCRRAATAVTKLALRGAIGSEAASKVSAYRAFRTDLRDAFSEYAGAYVSIDVLLSWATTRFAVVLVRHDTRAEGRSSYTFGRLATHALNVLTGFSTRPLRIASLVGLAFTGLGVALLALVVVRYLVNGRDVVPGFPFLASMIAIFSGVQLLTLGIIGEYLARVHVRVMDRPAYTVRDEIGE
jgi:glycosyltransferase involved in cell wall biosynthesis